MHESQNKLPYREHIRSADKRTNKKMQQESTTIIKSVNASLNFNEKIINRKSYSKSKSRFKECCNEITTEISQFKPVINELPFQIYPQRWGKNTMSKEEQWEQLIKDNRQRIIMRTQKKIYKEEASLKQLTFSPNIRLTSEEHSRQKQNIYEKLYKEAEQRRKELLIKEHQVLRDELKNKNSEKSKSKGKQKLLNSQKHDLSPIYERIQKILEEKRKNKAQLQQRLVAKYNFQPIIDPHSSIVAMKNQKINNVVDRLLDEYKQKQKRIDILKQKYIEQSLKQVTFKPQINNFISIQINKHEQKQNHQNKNDMNSFRPQLNNLSLLLTQQRCHQTFDQKIYRLHNAPIIKKDRNIQIIQDQVYAECSFNPQINKISHLSSKIHPKNHCCPVQKCQSPTFKPIINQISQILTEQKRKASLQLFKNKSTSRKQHFKKDEQYEKMKECSFKPKINDNKNQRTKIKNEKSVENIAGFRNYFQNIERANQKQQIKKQAEEKIFNLQKYYDLRMKNREKGVIKKN